MLTSNQIIELIAKNQSNIQKFGVKRIGLFGSFLKNNYMDLKFYLEGLFKRDVDLVVKEALKVQLKSNILRSVKYAT